MFKSAEGSDLFGFTRSMLMRDTRNSVTVRRAPSRCISVLSSYLGIVEPSTRRVLISEMVVSTQVSGVVGSRFWACTAAHQGEMTATAPALEDLSACH